MIEDSLDGFGGGQTEKQEMEEFNNRRSLVKGQKLAEILKLVPKYRDIQAVSLFLHSQLDRNEQLV